MHSVTKHKYNAGTYRYKGQLMAHIFSMRRPRVAFKIGHHLIVKYLFFVKCMCCIFFLLIKIYTILIRHSFLGDVKVCCEVLENKPFQAIPVYDTNTLADQKQGSDAGVHSLDHSKHINDTRHPNAETNSFPIKD